MILFYRWKNWSSERWTGVNGNNLKVHIRPSKKNSRSSVFGVWMDARGRHYGRPASPESCSTSPNGLALLLGCLFVPQWGPLLRLTHLLLITAEEQWTRVSWPSVTVSSLAPGQICICGSMSSRTSGHLRGVHGLATVLPRGDLCWLPLAPCCLLSILQLASSIANAYLTFFRGPFGHHHGSWGAAKASHPHPQTGFQAPLWALTQPTAPASCVAPTAFTWQCSDAKLLWAPHHHHRTTGLPQQASLSPAREAFSTGKRSALCGSWQASPLTG